jgi:hypothetical protein
MLYSDGSLKWHVVCMVSAEMLNCKLLSTQAAGIKHFTLHDLKSPMASHGRTLARTLYSGEEPNVIDRLLNFCHISINK